MAPVGQTDKRAIFPRHSQRRFLEQVCKRLNGDWDKVAKLCSVHRRTLFDWRREKYTISASAVEQIQHQLQLTPRQFRLVESYHYVRRAGQIGARARYQLYGNPGTPEGRRKGGVTTQQLFQQHPARALRVGFQVRKSIRRPTHSRQLAEFVGLMLGDGHIARYQAVLYFNRWTEHQLACYAQRLVARLFGVQATLGQNKGNCWTVVISSKNLTEWLPTIGLPMGDKIAHHSEIPNWIFQRSEWMQACLRGLIDTDGSVFFHAHTVHHHRYRHIGLAFTSYSPTLLDSTGRLIKALGYRPKVYQKTGHLFLYRRDEVNRYMREIGTHNPNHLSKFQSYHSSAVG